MFTPVVQIYCSNVNHISCYLFFLQIKNRDEFIIICIICFVFSLARKKSSGLESAATIRTKVFVWGLNDKDQLGGLKGSKVQFIILYILNCLFMIITNQM